MGEKKQYRLQMDFPFYTQRMTQETWKEEGFSSFSEADSWTFRSCGIASLRMILEGLGKQVERHGTMIAKGVAAGAYKEGVGWIHWGLAKLAADYGIYGEALRKNSRGLKAGAGCRASLHGFCGTPFSRGQAQAGRQRCLREKRTFGACAWL